MAWVHSGQVADLDERLKKSGWSGRGVPYILAVFYDRNCSACKKLLSLLRYHYNDMESAAGSTRLWRVLTVELLEISEPGVEKRLRELQGSEDVGVPYVVLYYKGEVVRSIRGLNYEIFDWLFPYLWKVVVEGVRRQ